MTGAGAVKRFLGSFFPGIVLVRGPRAVGRRIALTFDDGPHAANTPRVLAILRDTGANATFFVSGLLARSHPELVRQIDQAGHEIGNHGYAHKSARGMGVADYVKQVVDTHELLEGIIGRPLRRLYRPPYGDITAATLLALVARRYQFVYWTVDSNDSFVRDPGELDAAMASQTIAPGSILLFHEDYEHSVAALPAIIGRLKEQGYELVTVSELQGAKRPVRQPPGASTARPDEDGTGRLRPLKTRIKGNVIRALAPAGAFEFARSMRRTLADELPILVYHRVCDLQNEDQYPFDPELVSASTDDFAWQMQYVGEHFTPITFARLVDHLDAGIPMPPSPMIVTFDDGFRDNYTHAFPILRKLGIPATIFLSTGYLDDRQPFWFEWVMYLIHRMPGPVLELPHGEVLELGLTSGARRAAAAALVARLKAVDDEERLERLGWLQERHAAIVRPEDSRLSEPVTWHEVVEMAGAGVEFGSHGVSHPILSNIRTAGKLTNELLLSKEAIERRTGRPVQVLAYPVGSPDAYNERTIETARQCGYKVAVSYIAGINALSKLNRYEMLRMHVEREIDRAGFRAMFAWPRVHG
jgi:peptidoglycan/xylan/chitin deacetylase (PgdA/CDA1 family)